MPAKPILRCMSLPEWSLLVGALLVTMVLAGTLLGRLPLSSAMVYLALGWLLGPHGANVLRPDPLLHAGLLERMAEVALLISLFAVGMKLGVPLRDRAWRLPLRLAFLSMGLMVALITVVGVWLPRSTTPLALRRCRCVCPHRRPCA